jgi:hypothetical protein
MNETVLMHKMVESLHKFVDNCLSLTFIFGSYSNVLRIHEIQGHTDTQIA